MTEKFFLVKVTIPEETRFSRELSDSHAAMHLANFGATMMTFYTEGPAPTVACRPYQPTQSEFIEKVES